MFGLNALRRAIGTLAANVLGLAGTVAEVNAHLRQRAALDSAEPPVEALTLTVPTVPPGVAQDAPPAPGRPTAHPTPAAGRNGRKRTTAAAAAE